MNLDQFIVHEFAYSKACLYHATLYIHRALHNQLQSLLQAMMNLGGIQSEKEAVNFLLDKVGDPHITSYVNHHPNSRKAPHFIVPDIHARNFPAGKETINDSGATSTAEAFFERSKPTQHAKADVQTQQ